MEKLSRRQRRRVKREERAAANDTVRLLLRNPSPYECLRMFTDAMNFMRAEPPAWPDQMKGVSVGFKLPEEDDDGEEANQTPAREASAPAGRGSSC